MLDRRFVHRGFALLALLALPACATFSYQQDEVLLENTTWRIVEVSGMGAATRSGDLDLRPHFVIESGDGEIHGAGGCNRFSGAYQATGTEISFGPFVTTRSICPNPERQAIEDEILRVLGAATSYRIQGSTLWLYIGGDAALEAEVW